MPTEQEFQDTKKAINSFKDNPVGVGGCCNIS